MTGHDDNAPIEYTIRLPERFWRRLLTTNYARDNLRTSAFRAFSEAQRTQNGGGHARYITSDHTTVSRIIAMLLDLVDAIRNKDCAAVTFGMGLGDIDRWANQRMKLRSLVQIVPVPEEAE